MKLLKSITAAAVAFYSLAGVGIRREPDTFKSSKFYTPVQEQEKVERFNVTESFPIYALKNTYIFHNRNLLSGTVQSVKIGEELYTAGLQDSYYVVNLGLVREHDFTLDKHYVFYPIDRIKYANDGAVGLDALEGNIISTYSLNDEVHLIGRNDYGYYLTDQNEYVKATDVMNTPYVAPTPNPVNQTPAVAAYTPPTGSGYLTPSAGVFYGPSGKETYYNLPMGGVISIAQAAGIQGNYWERSDGAKMYGNYIICACGFSVRPRGTVIQTSLGPGICLDTGGFAANDPYQIDIAVTW